MRPRFLVVDDDAGNREAVAEILRQRDQAFEVETAASAE